MESPDSFYLLADLPQRESVSKKAISTGWWELDQIFKFYPGQFVVVTGIAGHGKSTFVLNMLRHLAQDGINSFLYVPENETYLYEKLSLIWNDEQSFSDFAQRQCVVLSATPKDIQEPPKDLRWVLDKAYEAIERYKIEFVLIDPWNELERVKPRDLTMADYITQCLMLIKQFCRATNCIVIMVAHPTKDVRDAKGGLRTPGLADIEGSMAWYNKCDNGLIVWRDPKHENTSKVISAKVREIGAGKRGSCSFLVDPNTGIFKPQYGAVDATESGLDPAYSRGGTNGYGSTKGEDRSNWHEMD